MSEGAPPARSGRFARFAREPLLHFLVIGTVLFTVYSAVSRDGSGAPGEIVVTRARIDTLAEGFARTWLRPPTDEELSALIDDFVNEEIYYREALALGLDLDDTVIRRRLRQKMEFVSEDLGAGIAPGDEELDRYFEMNAARFAHPVRLTFQQLYFSAERRGEAAQSDAERLLAQLESEASPASPADVADPTLLPRTMAAADAQEIANAFGDEFAEKLAKLPVGSWGGPLRSPYGFHIVRVERRDPGAARTLDEARAEVVRAWEAELRTETNRAFLARLRAGYEVRIEP